MDNDNSRIPVFLYAVGGLIVVLFLAPVLVVVPLSFTDRASFIFPPDGWSLRFYRNLFENDAWRDALLTSVSLGIVVALIAVLIGTLAAFGLSRSRSALARVLEAVLLAPMILPTVVLAVALFSLYLRWQLTGTFVGFVLAHTVITLPFVLVTMRAGIQGMDPNLAKASASLGATPVAGFALVTLPQLLPSMLTAFGFAFVLSFDEVVVSLFIQSPSLQTLPVKMWASIDTGTDPTIAAASTLTFVLSIVIISLWQYASRRKRG